MQKLASNQNMKFEDTYRLSQDPGSQEIKSPDLESPSGRNMETYEEFNSLNLQPPSGSNTQTYDDSIKATQPYGMLVEIIPTHLPQEVSVNTKLKNLAELIKYRVQVLSSVDVATAKIVPTVPNLSSATLKQQKKFRSTMTGTMKNFMSHIASYSRSIEIPETEYSKSSQNSMLLKGQQYQKMSGKEAEAASIVRKVDIDVDVPVNAYGTDLRSKAHYSEAYSIAKSTRTFSLPTQHLVVNTSSIIPNRFGDMSTAAVNKVTHQRKKGGGFKTKGKKGKQKDKVKESEESWKVLLSTIRQIKKMPSPVRTQASRVKKDARRFCVASVIRGMTRNSNSSNQPSLSSDTILMSMSKGLGSTST